MKPKTEQLKTGELVYPPRHYVRRSELVVWLQEELGICPWRTRQLIERGVIRRHALSCFKREGRYVPREVAAAVLEKNGLTAECAEGAE